MQSFLAPQVETNMRITEQLPYNLSVVAAEAFASPNSAAGYKNSGYDDSLTDIRWLGTMDAGVNFPSLDPADRKLSICNKENKLRGKTSSCKKLDYEKKEKSDVHKLRPPFSYAALISLAINSHPQKMMTLNSIYQWIEMHFPFFRMPEAKAWKNSIRHNLSIKKTLFQKVYLEPPRRGNGAFWTLLPDGQEEVQRCLKLFATLQPPVIDEQATTLHQISSSTHIVRSKGQFTPALLDSVSDSDNTEQLFLQQDNFLQREGFIHAHPPSIQPYHPSSFSCSPAPIAHESSANNSTLLDASFLTPLKDTSNFIPEVDMNTISLSPLFSFVTPKSSQFVETRKQQQQLSHYSQQPSGYSLTPSKHIPFPDSESSVYSSIDLGLSTPVKDLNSLTEISQLPSAFNTPSRDFCPHDLNISPTKTPESTYEFMGKSLCNLSPL